MALVDNDTRLFASDLHHIALDLRGPVRERRAVRRVQARSHIAKIFGVVVDALSLSESVDRAEQLIDAAQPAHHVCLNAAKVVSNRRDARLRETFKDADMVSVDGQSVVWASRLLGSPVPERVAGIDLMESLLVRAAERRWPVYFIGGTDDSVAGCVAHFRRTHRDLVVAGARNGYWSSDEEADVLGEIRASGARLVLVALPTPKKEYLVHERLAEFGPALVVGVGGSFDVFAGLTSRAPVWAQRAGLEWAFRLLQEPRRMWKRYLVGNTKFLLILAAELLRRFTTHSMRAATKRAIDVVAGLVLGVIALPIVVACAIGVMVSLKTWRPLFLQRRIGHRGQTILMPKLRTLPPTAPAYALKTQLKFDELPRFARLMRRTHLDELPQLALVIAGKLSLVGPRPKMPDDAEPVDPEYGAKRVTVRQGCTGLWQISAAKTELPSHAPEFDLLYVDSHSVRLDLWILWRTLLTNLGLRPLITLADIPAWVRRSAADI